MWRKDRQPSGGGGSGSSVADSQINGNIVVDGVEIEVYDDSGKADFVHQHTLSQITDVDANNKTNGYAMIYDAASSKVKLQPLPTGLGNGATSLDGLSDVDVTTTAPSEGAALKYVGGVWKPGTIAGSGGEWQAHADEPLNIPSYYGGKGQGTHPSVYYFASKYKGYNYWMAFTPYPNADAFEENPVVVVSNNGIDWILFPGSVNPIDSIPLSLKGIEYFSDTHLVHRPDTGVLECWYRKVIVGAAEKGEVIYRKTTSNGSTWSAAEEMKRIMSPVQDKLLSPAVIWDNVRKLYLIWVVEPGGVGYYESADGKAWTFIRNTGLQCWHIDVVKTDAGYEYTLYKQNPSILTHTVTQDHITFTPEKTLMVGRGAGFWDATLYRSSLIKVGTQYRLYYAGVSATGPWRIGLSIASKPNDITSLIGYNGGSNATVTTIAVDLGQKLNDVLPLLRGTTAERKKLTNYLTASHIGVPFWDTDLGKSLWAKRFASGRIVWSDALGVDIPFTDTPPTVSQNIANVSATSGQPALINFNATDDFQIVTFAYSKDGGSTYINLGPKDMGNGNYQLSVTGLAVGAHSFKVGVKDQSQQWAYSNSFTVTVT